MGTSGAQLVKVRIPDADVVLSLAWLDLEPATALFRTLHDGLPWTVHRVRLFGRELAAPRLSCWIGDPDAGYRYSGVRHEPVPWPPVLLPLRERLQAETGVAFNSVLANLYRDGRDSMGWHSDDEPELGPAPVIASLSLGAARRFSLRHRRRAGQRVDLELPHGSLLLMRGATQANWQHAVPRTARAVGPRVNLTFRYVIPGRMTGPAADA